MWSTSSRIAFYVGILSLIAGLSIRFFNIDFMGIAPTRFMEFSQCWFLISIAIIASEILKKLEAKKT